MAQKTTQNKTSSAYKRFRKICPIPTPEFIDEQLALYKKTDVYDEEERLIHYFRENRLNKSPFSVRNKVRAVKGFLRSRLSERDLSSRILALAAFDSKLEHGYSTAVDYLTATGLPRWKYSTFAQFYCYFHRPDQYLPGYSVITTLRTYAQLDGFVKEDKTDLILCYSDYRKIVKAFQKYYGLQQYTETELIHFLFMVEQYLQIELDRPAMERRKAKLELEKLKEKIRIRNSMRSSKNDAILQILQSSSGDNRKGLLGEEL